MRMINVDQLLRVTWFNPKSPYRNIPLFINGIIHYCKAREWDSLTYR